MRALLSCDLCKARQNLTVPFVEQREVANREDAIDPPAPTNLKAAEAGAHNHDIEVVVRGRAGHGLAGRLRIGVHGILD